MWNLALPIRRVIRVDDRTCKPNWSSRRTDCDRNIELLSHCCWKGNSNTYNVKWFKFNSSSWLCTEITSYTVFNGIQSFMTPVILVTQLADQLQVIRLPCRSVVSKDVMKWFMRQVIYVKSSQHFLFFSQNESSPVNASDLSDFLACLIPDDVSTSGEVWWWTRFLCSCKQEFSTFYRRTTYCWKGYGFDDDRAYMIRIYLWILELSKSHLFSDIRKHNNSKGILALWRFEQILR